MRLTLSLEGHVGASLVVDSQQNSILHQLLSNAGRNLLEGRVGLHAVLDRVPRPYRIPTHSGRERCEARAANGGEREGELTPPSSSW